MPYGWTHEVEVLSACHWIEFTEFMHIMNGFRFKAFSVKAQRDSMRNELNNLNIGCPFSPTTRFPDNTVWINLNHSVPGRLIRNLIMALDMADRQVEKGRAKPDTEEIRSASNMEDAKTSFYNHLESLTDMLGAKPVEYGFIVGIYTQGTFERKTGLVWS